jgi:hypothetical protein
MYRYYENATVCYAYLSDVPLADPFDMDIFINSRWFTRGWTLQELIAPIKLVFFSKHWGELAQKNDVVEVISCVTNIPEKILNKTAKPAEFSVAARMSWASQRHTTRIEDEAYSLMGLFGINMPLIYGEKERAFMRLQEEIMKTTDDQSIFAWSLTNPKVSRDEGWEVTGLLAESPNAFADSGNIVSMGIWGKGNVQGMTSRGTRARLFLKFLGESNNVDYVASLDCWLSEAREHTAVIFLRRLGPNLTDWNSAHETIFNRCHPYDYLGQGSRSSRAKGMYRDICVPQLNRSLVEWSLPTYNHTGAHILIHHPDRPYSVYPADSWESQTAVFTLQRSNTGTIGVVSISGDYCTYLVFFGSYMKSDGSHLWVKATFNSSDPESVDEDIWMSYQPTGEETSTSELVNQGPAGMNLYTEKISATTKLTVVYTVVIFEIHIVLSRTYPREITMQDHEDKGSNILPRDHNHLIGSI